MATTDSKRNGRFIKKGDPLHKVLTISDFSLADICETPITFHDNANANVIHEKLHVKEELAQTVRLSHEIETVFPNQEERMLIRPLDFTEEWHRLRKRQSSRTMRTDEDEDFEIEAARAEEAEQDEHDLAAMESRFANGNGEGEETTQQEESVAAPIKETAPAPKATEPAPAQVMAASPAPVAQPEPEMEEDDFVPYAAQNQSNQPNHFSTPERGLNEEELDQLRQEAREEGFRQGYQSGEERATLESRSKVQAILEEVANIVDNLEGMQKSILDHAQTNFYTICKNFVESMLHKEFAMSPEIFGSFIERAVNEALNEDEFKIFVSSKVAKDLKSWSNDELKARIRADDNLKDFNFRVEGEHSSVDGNISKVIKDLLDSADLNLFDSNKDKVG